ncbi:hypothetical protein CPC08DRAFT_411999 [Agrocybe pediades]|nr:hypothetical protein CPC08DRAFT_411999 [Agrocybe pediades]
MSTSMFSVSKLLGKGRKGSKRGPPSISSVSTEKEKEGLSVPNGQMSRVKIDPYEQVEDSKAFLKIEDNYLPKAELQDLYTQLFTSDHTQMQDSQRREGLDGTHKILFRRAKNAYLTWRTHEMQIIFIEWKAGLKTNQSILEMPIRRRRSISPSQN